MFLMENNAVMYIILCVSSFTIATHQRKTTMEKAVLIRRFDNCPGAQNLKGRFISHQIILQKGGRTAIRAVMEVKSDTQLITKVGVRVDRCPSYSEREKCEFLTKVPVKGNVCWLLRQKNQFWTPIVENIEPKLYCPFKMGNYTLKETSFDANTFLGLMSGVGSHYYEFTATAYDETNEKVACFLVGGQIVTIRV